MAQQIAASPTMWRLPPWGRERWIHTQYYSNELGLFVAPITRATKDTVYYLSTIVTKLYIFIEHVNRLLRYSPIRGMILDSNCYGASAAARGQNCNAERIISSSARDRCLLGLGDRRSMYIRCQGTPFLSHEGRVRRRHGAATARTTHAVMPKRAHHPSKCQRTYQIGNFL